MGYSIFNIKGQRIYSGNIDRYHKEQSFELPEDVLKQMANGIYLLCLEQGQSKIATTKLVVVK